MKFFIKIDKAAINYCYICNKQTHERSY